MVDRLLAPEAGAGTFVTEDPRLKELLDLIDTVAPRDVLALITGESGTGKELVARRLHERSRRSAGPFAVVNCAALPESLAESELFGHERGAFTRAERQRGGRFEEVHGGTFFLDEVGELPAALQAKLLRVLEERVVRRLGGAADIPVDVRLVAATNRDLQGAVAQGSFRQDLYFRLAVVPIHLPPLRERAGDIPVLARHLLAILATPATVSPCPTWPRPRSARWRANGGRGTCGSCEKKIKKKTNPRRNKTSLQPEGYLLRRLLLFGDHPCRHFTIHS